MARDLSYLRPEGCDWHHTIGEVASTFGRDVTYIRKLEREGRIPQALRHQLGKLSIRLWSPEQVVLIENILAGMRPGRPRG